MDPRLFANARLNSPASQFLLFSQPPLISLRPMKSNSSRVLLVINLLLAAAGLNLSAAETNLPRERLLLDSGWKFHLGNEWGNPINLAKAGSSTGPAGRSFSDTSWRTVNLPHDWAIELPFDQGADGSHGFRPVGTGFAANSVAWYRRNFELPKEDAGQTAVAGIRRRVPRRGSVRQRLARRPPRERLQRLSLRHHRRGQCRRPKCCRGEGGRHAIRGLVL